MRYCLGAPSDLTNLYLAFVFMPLGLFFDLFDGKVARWRKKSSLMGQELDSLADLVCAYVGPRYRYKLTVTDLVRSGTRISRSRNRSSDKCRPDPAQFLRPLRPHSTCPFQRHGSNPAERRDRQIKVLRRHSDTVRVPHVFGDHGFSYGHGSNTR